MSEQAGDRNEGITGTPKKLFDTQPEKASTTGRRRFKNMTDTRLFLGDLGTQNALGQMVSFETLEPHETKDLGAYYTDEQLLKSRAIRDFIERKFLVELEVGEPVPGNPVSSPAGVIRQRGKEMNEFADPTVDNEYDIRLEEVKRQAEEEDRATQIGSGAR